MWRFWLIYVPSRLLDGLLVLYQIFLIILITFLFTGIALEVLDWALRQ